MSLRIVVVDADPIKGLGDGVKVVLPAVGHVLAEMIEDVRRIFLAEDATQEPAVVDAIVKLCAVGGLGTVIGTLENS